MNCNIRGYILQYFLNEVYYQFEKKFDFRNDTFFRDQHDFEQVLKNRIKFYFIENQGWQERDSSSPNVKIGCWRMAFSCWLHQLFKISLTAGSLLPKARS